jgi:DNA-binding PadR family transcriptional regulator
MAHSRHQPDDLAELKRRAVQRYLDRSVRGPMLGGGGFGSGRVRRRRGDVRAALLLLLADEPRNGYQLMQAIEARSGGRWRPSPGSIYPTLAQLEAEGLIQSNELAGGKLFELADAGRRHLRQHEHSAPPWSGEEESEALADLHAQMAQLHVAASQVAQAGQEAQVARAAEKLAEARRALYRILAEDDDGEG